MPLDANFNQSTYPWDAVADSRLRTEPVAAQGAFSDPLAALNRVSLLEASLLSGHQGFDYQNPYVWTSRGILADADLVPDYGLIGATAAGVAANVAASGRALDIP